MQEQKRKQMDPVFFSKIPHEIQYAPVKQDPLYEQAFYPREEDDDSGYSRNTTTWD